MSAKINGAWRTPATTHVKINGSWRLASTMYTKINGSWRTTTFAGPPPVPVLAYTAQGAFTITDYNPALTYTVVGASRNGNQLTNVSNGATIRAAYAAGAPQSAPRTMYVANHGRVLTTVASNPSSSGCSPRGFVACPGGTISDTAGSLGCAGPGTQGPYCGGSCPDNQCFGNFCTCWNYYWTDYSGSGYILIGSVWGKAA